jgi:biopolymer transport protein ExbD
MRLDGAIPRRRAISLTSLIDVIFLLLLFFMLSSTFTRFSEIEVTGGAAAATAVGERPDILVTLGAHDSWRVNGVAGSAESSIGELLRLEAAGAQSAVLLVRGDINSQSMVSAIEEIRAATGLSLSVAR